MKCKSCNENIPSKFAHAFKTNSCPYCGQEIMDGQLQSILNDLSTALDNSTDYSDQIEDWMETNYNFKKIKAPNKNHQQVIVDSNRIIDNEASVKSKPITRVSDAPVQQEQTLFSKRAGIKPLTPKNIVEKIQGSSEIDLDDTIEDDYVDDNSSLEESFGSAPLNHIEHNEIMNIFDTSPAIEKQLEIEKLKRIRNQGFGKIKREDA